MKLTPKTIKLIVLVVVLVGGWAIQKWAPQWLEDGGASKPQTRSDRAPSPKPGGGTTTASGRVSAALAQAIAQKRSKVWVEGDGRIVHLLPDDTRPPRHQLCLVELADGHTIKISHNVDLAPKIPWHKGDILAFRGRFEWNAKGGVVHWTHHDPSGRKQGGWLELDGKRYK